MSVEDWIQPEYITNDAKEELLEKFSKNSPFKHIQITDFFIPEKLEIVLAALGEEHFFEKESDLFKFMQTQDLAHTKNTVLQEFIQFLYSTEFIQFMEDITKFNLNKKEVDIAGTLYQDTDFLLCHDDELEGRKIAFLVYLSTQTEEDGGSLKLYSHKDGKPHAVEKKLYPKINSFTFFEVSETSFHEVEEIYTDTQRIAIGGWYHSN
ncbi:MAG: 2OG-Fe(II) oxygenase family protein [Candidatus Woesearchaeota archaeon]